LKRFFLLSILIFSAIIAKAQGDFNYMPSGLGFDVSTIRGYTNVAKQNNTLSFSGFYSYYPSPYFPITFELQRGRLWGGSRVTDEYKREYVNNYTAILLHSDIQLGELVDYEDNDFMNILKNLYFGFGGGFVNSNVQNQRYNLVADGYAIGTYRFPGKDKSFNPDVNFRLGYEFKFYNQWDEPHFRLHVEYTHHFVFGEGLDGYDDPATHFKNDHVDQYRQITIGLIYNFGTIRAYTKHIRNEW
jgi:hypothetical protein